MGHVKCITYIYIYIASLHYLRVPIDSVTTAQKYPVEGLKATDRKVLDLPLYETDPLNRNINPDTVSVGILMMGWPYPKKNMLFAMAS